MNKNSIMQLTDAEIAQCSGGSLMEEYLQYEHNMRQRNQAPAGLKDRYHWCSTVCPDCQECSWNKPYTRHNHRYDRPDRDNNGDSFEL